MLGVLVNAVAVLVGSFIGVLLKKGFPENVEKTVLTGVGLCVLVLGMQGALQEPKVLVVILSIALGGIVGGFLDIDGLLNRAAKRVEEKFRKNASGGPSLAEGFVTGTLLFCVGSMTILGSFNAGLRGDNEMLFTKAILDFFSAMMLSVTLGIGVGTSALAVFVLQGGLVLLAGVLEPILSPSMIAQIACVGSVIMLGIGFNLAGMSKIKVANFMPAILFAPFLCLAFEWIGM